MNEEKYTYIMSPNLALWQCIILDFPTIFLRFMSGGHKNKAASLAWQSRAMEGKMEDLKSDFWDLTIIQNSF